MGNAAVGKAPSVNSDSRDRLVVRTLRCGRNDPGSNPGHGRNGITFFFCLDSLVFYFGVTGTPAPVSFIKQQIFQ